MLTSISGKPDQIVMLLGFLIGFGLDGFESVTENGILRPQRLNFLLEADAGTRRSFGAHD